MVEPTGPLPASVYRRRRAIALGSSVLLVVLLAIGVSTWVSGGSPADPRAVADQRPASTSSSSPPTSGTIVPAGGSSSASPSPSPAPTTTSSAPPTTTSPPPPGPCPDESVAVSARVAQPSYRVGQAPLLTLVITNSGKLACNRDLSRKLRELVVLTGDNKTRLWSSADCYYEPPPESRLLQPGEQATYSIAWAGLTSAPQCAPSGARVPAGDYVVVGKLGKLTSEPTPFKLT
ncbi:hypothetical protein [Kutzneria albida]|uniref:Putative secreted protein n=1 Tax=Kutzneria albida DSM 43870 TaxID=1449976 RepID=W5VZ91_9PSEU|nr:hypothetical protein [Kutzneria albida]AHH93775.1 putative secreted protein [Kutzneria albida DSM 43870]